MENNMKINVTNDKHMVTGQIPVTYEEALEQAVKLEKFAACFTKDFRYVKVLGAEVRIRGLTSVEKYMDKECGNARHALATLPNRVDRICHHVIAERGLPVSAITKLRAACFYTMWTEMPRKARFLVNAVINKNLSATQLSTQQCRYLADRLNISVTIPRDRDNLKGYFTEPQTPAYAVGWLTPSNILRITVFDKHSEAELLYSSLESTGVPVCTNYCWYGDEEQERLMRNALLSKNKNETEAS